MQARNKVGLIVGAAVTIGALVLPVTLGSYDVGATTPHWEPVERVLRAVLVHSVRVHAAAVTKPADVNLDDPSFAARGFGHYSAACRTCHGAPGLKADPWMFTYPPAPELSRADITGAWSDEELFWILKNGIKDTGMMALGPTHKDADIWAVTAFVKQLPKLSMAQYQALADQKRAEQESAASPHGHPH